MKILFIPGGLGYGHVSRCLALADELKLLGIRDIAFAYGGPNEIIIKQEGYKVFPVYELTEKQIVEKAGKLPSGAQGPKAIFELIGDDEFIIKSIEDEVKAIESWNADLVVYEGRWTGNASALVKKIPSISIIQNYLFSQPEVIPESLSGMVQALNVFKEKINIYRRKLGISIVEGIFQLFTSDFNIAPTIEGFGKIADANRSSIEYWGPFIRKPQSEGEEPEWMKRLNPDKKTVYISTGGTKRAKAMLQTALDILKELDDVQAVVSTGFDEFSYDVKTLPERIILKPYVPGVLMTLKSDVIVTHGGHSTLMELLKHKVPGLVIPFQPEQLSYGRILEQANAGKVIPSEAFNKERFKQCLTDLLLNEKYKSGIADLGRCVESYPGVTGAAKEIIKRYGFNRTI